MPLLTRAKRDFNRTRWCDVRYEIENFFMLKLADSGITFPALLSAAGCDGDRSGLCLCVRMRVRVSRAPHVRVRFRVCACAC